MAGNMHPYQIDEEIRIRVFIISAFLAVGAARILNLAIQALPFSIPWWVETPSVLGFFGLFVWLFDSYFWKIKFIQQMEWFYIPNLNGVWETEIKSSYTDFDKSVQARTIIRQTASKISISLETDTSSSHSIHAALMRTERVNKFELAYNYINTPKADSLSSMSIHHGTVWLQISDTGQILDGEYYSGRGRQNFGRLVFKRL
jgi:hypothetical protein